MMAFIQANNRNGIRTTLKSLEDKFTIKPYGWDLAAIQCLLAKLCGRGKVEALFQTVTYWRMMPDRYELYGIHMVS